MGETLDLWDLAALKMAEAGSIPVKVKAVRVGTTLFSSMPRDALLHLSSVSAMKTRLTLFTLLILASGVAGALSKPTRSADVHFDARSSVLNQSGLEALESVIEWSKNPRLCTVIVNVVSELNDADLADPRFVALVAARASTVRDHLVNAGLVSAKVGTSVTLTQGVADDRRYRGVVQVEAQAWLRTADGTCY